MSSRQQSELDPSTQEKIIDLFDNEAVWDADDTDGYIIQIFHDLEAAGASLVALKDQGWNTLLHVASLWNRPTIMEELVRKGASLNSKNKNGHTPLDLAMHWGHFDIGQQLRHYGGKHTCEQERDIAISQRDLAQQQLKNCELEHEHSVKSLKQAKQDREQLRIERDRLVVLRAQVVEDFRELSNQIEGYRSAAASLTKERDDWSIQAAQLQSELECEKAARNNAVQSWKVAEKIIADLQQIQEECREREEEALRLRNEAIQDRDVARERAKEAQLDQGIAKQNQLEVENQRDRAVERLLQGESEMAQDKERWRKLIAKTELERRNIQIEIDRQTEILRCENAKLEKTVASLTIANTRQKADLERSQLTIRTLEKQFDRHQQDLKSEADRYLELKEQVEALLAERRLEHKAWRTQLELKMQQEFSDELKRILEGVIKTWKTLLTCQEKINTVATAVEPRATSPSRTPAIMSSIFQTQRPHTSAAGLGSPGFLPFIQEAPVGLKGSTSTSALLESSESGIVSDPVFTDQENTIKNHRAQAEKALQELAMGTTSEQIIQLCAFVQNFIEEVTAFLSANFQRLRRRAQAQEKIIERKGELIQRFTHHREEKAKRQNPARFRECSVRPQR
ncbi:Ankyrin-2 [Phytophthora citrophthora]|uniref:Ankyrin-2 n=1 Tax=Phytophthora citrophthora TaxID=4793 RepID=A0AAD9GKP2_9STRA|nr:Ankyrin-2 [Phytophthora citrophthora]